MRALKNISPFIWILLLASFMAFAFQGTRGLWEPDEGRYTNVALEMMHTGDYFVPHRNYESLHVTKPPVTYWALATSMQSFGKNEWAARLPIALAFILTTLLVFQLGKSLNSKQPWLPPLIYVCSPLPFIAANIITTDTLLAFAETAAVLAFVRFRFDNKSLRYLDLMWGLFGLAFMIKGPPGLLPLLAIFVWQWRNGSIKVLARPLGIATFIVVGFTWFFLITQQKPELLDYFLHHEVVDRVASGTHARNSQWYGGLFVYIPTLLIGALPWLALSVWNVRKSIAHKPLQPKTTFLLYWITIPLVIFMLSQSRLPLYLLPLFVPIALLLARTFKGVTFSKQHFIWLSIWLFMLLALKGIAGYVSYKDDAREFAHKLQQILPTKPHDLIFINSKAAYGLNFYLDVNIEKISIKNFTTAQPISDAEFDEDMRTEILELEEDRYFLVPKKQVTAFKIFLKKNQFKNEYLGTVNKFEIHTITKL
jgi:4-amino-4-deoxy-L-arabinose transferase-like glycosyltransferase